KALERGHLPDDGGPLAVDGILYLSETGSHRVSVPNLLAGLCQLLPPDLAERLDALTRDPKVATAHKMVALLEHFRHQPVVVLLDNLETLVDGETRALTDPDLDEALRALLAAPPHRAKLILTTRLAPRDLALHHPERQMPLNLDEGLASPYAENILRALDADGTLGLQRAPEPLLTEARERTRGYPRALEALFAILAADRESTLADLLAAPLPDNVVQALVGEAFSRLDPPAQLVMQALAIYARPVSPVAVDYLLQPYLPGVASAPLLGRLVNMHFARHEERHYYLHPADQEYALARLPAGSDDEQTPSQLILRRRAADYFRQARLPRGEWRSLEDLEPQLAEFDLRCSAQEYEAAWDVFADISYELALWGHHRLRIEMGEVLRNRLTDATSRCNWLNELASSYFRLGKFQQAINSLEQSLHEARSFHMQWQELIGLNGLASCYADVGNTMQAIVLYQQALAICEKTGRQNLAASILGNLGTCYADLGSNQQAKQYFEDAISIARQLDLRDTEASYLAFLADTLIVEDAFAEAIQCASDGAKIAEQIGSATAASLNYQFLAAAHLFAGQTQEARKAAASGHQYEESRSKHTVLNLIGLAALAQSEHQAARIAFQTANTETDSLLMHNPRNYLALDAKGLALCGLTLCEGESRVPAAIEVYRAARAVTVAPGIVGRALRLFDALATADEAGVLAPMRPVVAGER
ncbi:MAG: tetratricopeptide repeat protein, partial [Caldilineaceae bacterium]|nr:tetratricopeptide repeat protein [Caldilineaceae bacterium]